MTKPPTTLLEVERALAEQDATLEAAYRALIARGEGAVDIPAREVERIAAVCRAPAPRAAARPPRGGIHC